MSEKRKVIRVQCATCNRETNHDIVASHNEHEVDRQDGIQWWEDYQIAICRGCDAVSFVHSSACSEDFNPITGEVERKIVLYPDRTSGRMPLDRFQLFPPKTRRIYLEVVKAMNSSSPLLTAIGLRALIESICIDQKTKGDNLERRISELATLGLLSKKQADILHNHRFLGNIAAHEIEAPQPLELVAALDIAETLLKTIYILPTLDATITTGKKKTLAPAVP